MARVIADEVACTWPDYLRRDVPAACVFYSPREAVPLANVWNCLKMEIPQDVLHPDSTKEPFSPWNGRKSAGTGDSPYARAPGCTGLTPTGALTSDTALPIATSAWPRRRTLLLPCGPSARRAPRGNPHTLWLLCSPLLLVPNRGHAASWSRRTKRRASAATWRRTSAARNRRLRRALMQACSAPPTPAASTPARSARALGRWLGSGASRSGATPRRGDRSCRSPGWRGRLCFLLLRRREECTPSARRVPCDAEALWSTNALLTVLRHLLELGELGRRVTRSH